MNSNPEDRWARDNTVFIHYGKGYCVTENLSLVCIGKVDEKGYPVKTENRVPGVFVEHDQHPPSVKNGVSKLGAVSMQGDNNIHEQKRGVVLKHKKHSGGRPRKESGYSRVTDWRRRKEKQCLLL